MNEYELFLKVIFIFVAGTFFLRLSGRKSISQMTIGETVLTITLGTILASPISSKGIDFTVYSIAFLTLFFVIAEFLQVKYNVFEKLITGKSVDVIKGGNLNIDTLKNLRMTVDQLEMRLREKGISKIEDVKTATIEPNGKLGYELKQDARPITEKDLERILKKYGLVSKSSKESNKSTIFDEVKNTNTTNRTKNEQLK